MPQIKGRQQIAIKQEATAGTAETLAAADVIPHKGIAAWDSDAPVVAREFMTGSLSPRGSVVTTQAAKLTFAMHLAGTVGAPVAVTNEPDFSRPFQAAGMAPTVSGTSPNEQSSFVPSSTTISDETAGAYSTIALYEDGKRYMLHGAICSSCTLTFTVGSPVLAEFEFSGVWNKPTDTALLVPTYKALVEPIFLDAAVSILGFTTAKFQTLTLNFGLEVMMRHQPNNPTGWHTAQIVRRNATGSIDVEEELAATKDWYNEFIAGTAGLITTGVFESGGTNYNQLQLNIPNAKYTKPGLGDREGVSTAPLEFECTANSDAGEDEFEIIQT